MIRTRVKICGVGTREDAMAAVESGADAVGFVFHERSPRYIKPAAAWEILRDLPPFVASVGLTVNASPEHYGQIERACPADFSQLHGDEDAELVRACGARLIKAVRFDADTIEASLRYWSEFEEIDAILVDGSEGGRGEAFEWSALADAAHAAAKPIILAGGLTTENVGEAIRAVRPYAVDVSSGVEKERGVKDPARIRAFCAAVREADAALDRLA